jgi:hypothetical protein
MVGECQFKLDNMSRSHNVHVRMRITYIDLDRKSEREGVLGRPVCMWKVTIKTDVIEIIWEFLDQACLAQDTEPLWSV